MKHLIETHNLLVEKFAKLNNFDYKIVKDFENKMSGIKIITKMNIEYKILKESLKSTSTRVNRKLQILTILEDDTYTISYMAKECGITNRNISSILCYLRKDGKNISTIKIGGETYVTLTKED